MGTSDRVAEYEALGVYDPDAPNAADRLALLEWLAQRGFSAEEMAAAHRTGSLTGLAGDRAVGIPGELTVAEAAARTGMDAELVERVLGAAGFRPVGGDERLLAPDDLVLLELARGAVELFGEVPTLRFTRVVGASMAQIADAAIWTFLSDVEEPLMQAGGGELALAQANLRAVEALQTIPVVMGSVFRGHVELAVRRSRLARSHGRYDSARLAVGFVDLVGFTGLAEQRAGTEVASLIDDFEARAFEVVTRHEGRVVKLIGDEVMFVALDAAAGCAIALELLAAFRDAGDVTPRGGVAFGDLVARAGDYFGPIVNLGSRAAELAVPNEVLVTSGVVAAAGDATLEFAPAGRRMLKGFSDPVELFAVSRPVEHAPEPADV